MTGTTMLKVEGIHQYYGGSHILRGIDFEAKLGEVTVVLGRNGVGKTTLLKSLMGVVPGKTGRIRLGGRDITPFLLDHLQRETGGASLEANVRLVLRNASLAARISAAL